jgi:hypothetical protein
MKHVTSKLQVAILVVCLASKTFDAAAMGGLRLTPSLNTNQFNFISLRAIFTAELEFAPLKVLLKFNVMLFLVVFEAWFSLFLGFCWLFISVILFFFRFLLMLRCNDIISLASHHKLFTLLLML